MVLEVLLIPGSGNIAGVTSFVRSIIAGGGVSSC